ncbi:MAG: phospho-N-acetylmuramoyl-pentapeptide-transferase [Clostridia bacterium]|jgi:phospho-N-acetylmuramoyl-pentapeptide-transferase|nr:phospho-N-acetylmuramoyl-pentapeptide-transferase [Clostridia bacterium]MBT7123392.1 phospho-N-acetylmuramoyl-pentapeptide-transferase [Clostridia bacterium]
MGFSLYAIYALLAAFAIALILGYVGVPLLKRLKMGQQVRDDGPKTHLSKAGTPTMGGIVVILAVIIVTLVFSRGNLEYVWMALGVTLGFGLLGFADDLIIVVRKRSLGLKAYQKLIVQFIIALVIAYFAYRSPGIGSSLVVPFFGVEWNLGWWYIPFTAFAVVLIVNSVNLTDGLDGLASGVTLVNAATFTVIFFGLAAAYQAVGASEMSEGMNNMMVFTAAVAGACLGFLRFNTHPAKVFMGDTGAFALGGAISIMVIISRMQLLLIITGFMFLASSISVILQVGSYKLRKKRIFKMAPLHHHFELKGTPETKIVAFYTIITLILCLIGLLAIN